MYEAKLTSWYNVFFFLKNDRSMFYLGWHFDHIKYICFFDLLDLFVNRIDNRSTDSWVIKLQSRLFFTQFLYAKNTNHIMEPASKCNIEAGKYI